jgi:phage-related tail fiber protein
MDPGDVIIWPLETPKPLTFECNGQALSRITYANLFAKIGTTHGIGDNSTTFNVPDYRGFFLRGWSHGSGNDPDAASRTNRGDGVTGDRVGTGQGSMYTAHQHTGSFSGVGSSSSGSLYIASGFWAGQDWAIPYDAGGVSLIGNPEGGAQTVGAASPRTLGLSQIGVSVSVTITVSGATDYSGGNETRPKNKTVMFCIAY